MNQSEAGLTPDHKTPFRPRLIAPGVADWMLLILALALVAGLIKRHTSDPTMNFRLAQKPPVSVWTRLLIGHTLTGLGLVFGLSRLFCRIKIKSTKYNFGTWLWSVVGLYLLFYLFASICWSWVNFTRAYFKSNTSNYFIDLGPALARVAVLSSVQACYDSFAWFLAAIWAASASNLVTPHTTLPEIQSPYIEKSDITIAIYSAFVIVATVFQRLLESAGY